MNIELEHPFGIRCNDPIALLAGCQKLNTFLKNLEKQAEAYGEGNDDLVRVHKGDGLEFFCEFFIKSNSMDKRIGISDYKITEENEFGVDGYGTGADGKPATVQVKHRPFIHEITNGEDHISTFPAASCGPKFNVDPIPNSKGKCNMLIITTGKGLHYRTAEEMPTLRVLNRKQLMSLVDGHMPFWNSFRVSWAESLK